MANINLKKHPRRPGSDDYEQQLEDSFNATATINAEDDERVFLAQYFKKLAGTSDANQPIIEEFIEKLIQAAKDNLNEKDCEFLGVPLQTKLLANAFEEEFKTALSSGTVGRLKKFDLPYLYEEFIRKNNERLCSKFGEDAERARALFEKYQTLLALKILFEKRYLEKLNVEAQLSEFYKDEEFKKLFIQREGLMVVVDAEPVPIFNFVHRTLGEFLAAQWLSENCNSKDKEIKEAVKYLIIQHRFGSYFYSWTFLFRIFDCILARRSPLHLAIIHDKTEEAKQQIRSNPKSMEDLDAGGRSLLHLLALYGFNHSEYNVNEINTKDKLLDILNLIPNSKITNIKDAMLNFGPLDYAVVSWSWTIANKICEKSPDLTIDVDLNISGTYKPNDLLKYCTHLGYKSLFRVTLKLFACRDLLMNSVQEDTTLQSYCKKIVSKKFNLDDNYAKEINVECIGELFRFKNHSAISRHYYKDLRFAVSYGTEENVLSLLKDSNTLNDQDIYFNTPLHYAIMHDRLHVVKLLLSKGARINTPGRKGNTPLHCAAEKGYIEIASELLSRNIDVNVKNDEGDTPLFVAFNNEQRDVIKLLLRHGVDVNSQDRLGSTPLHWAARLGYDDIALDLLRKRADINKQMETLETPLHVALMQGHCGTAKILLSEGSNCLIEDQEGISPLLWALRQNLYDILLYMIAKGANLNKTWPLRVTPLHLALVGSKISIIELLLSKGATAITERLNESSSLHAAVLRDNHEIVLKILALGADINHRNEEGNTPLLLALENNLINVAKLLISCEADVSVKNRKGKTALDIANELGHKEIAFLLQNK